MDKTIENHIIVRCENKDYATDWLDSLNNIIEALAKSKVRGIWSPDAIFCEPNLNLSHGNVSVVEKESFVFVIVNIETLKISLDSLARVTTNKKCAVMSRDTSKPKWVKLNYLNSNEAHQQFFTRTKSLHMYHNHIINNLLSDKSPVPVEEVFGKQEEYKLIELLSSDQLNSLLELMRSQGWSKTHELVIVDKLEYMYAHRYHSSFDINSEKGLSWFKYILKDLIKDEPDVNFLLLISSDEKPVLSVCTTANEFLATKQCMSDAYFGSNTVISILSHDGSVNMVYPNTNKSPVREYLGNFIKFLDVVNDKSFKPESLLEIKEIKDIRKAISRHLLGVRRGE